MCVHVLLMAPYGHHRTVQSAMEMLLKMQYTLQCRHIATYCLYYVLRNRMYVYLTATLTPSPGQTSALYLYRQPWLDIRASVSDALLFAANQLPTSFGPYSASVAFPTQPLIVTAHRVVCTAITVLSATSRPMYSNSIRRAD